MRSDALGWISAIFGCLGLVFGFIEYVVWNHNNDVLKNNALFGQVSQQDIDIVNFQYDVMILAFVVGTILFLIGVAWIADVAGYNKQISKKIERTELVQAIHSAVLPRQPSFYCDQCGAVLSPKAQFCPVCGRRL